MYATEPQLQLVSQVKLVNDGTLVYVFCHVPACLLVAPACLTFVRTRFLLFPTCLLLLATSDVPAYWMVGPACFGHFGGHVRRVVFTNMCSAMFQHV